MLCLDNPLPPFPPSPSPLFFWSLEGGEEGALALSFGNYSNQHIWNLFYFFLSFRLKGEREESHRLQGLCSLSLLRVQQKVRIYHFQMIAIMLQSRRPDSAYMRTLVSSLFFLVKKTYFEQTCQDRVASEKDFLLLFDSTISTFES